MHSKLTIESSIHSYTIEFIDTMQVIQDLMKEPNTVSIVDSNVANLYPELNSGIIVEATEKAKTLEGAEDLLSQLSERRANVKTKLIVIGGGIIQDLAGFCASVYARGIEYILIPTTLLSQADSCVGGKTSINLRSKKNLIGTFYPPTKILINKEFLNTLTRKDYISGLGEIYKFSILQNDIENFDLSRDILEMIHEGLSYKISILKKDEFDKKERRFLNYGHTFGHAIETTSDNKIPHGLAVILGSMIAARVSKYLGYDVHNYEMILDKGIKLIKDSGLELERDWFNLDRLLEIVKSDKKSTGQLTMVLIDKEPFLKNIEDIEVIRKVLNETYESI